MNCRINLKRFVKKEGWMIDKSLLDILACPSCQGDVELKGDKIVCLSCDLKYPIKDDIPIMLVDEAEK